MGCYLALHLEVAVPDVTAALASVRHTHVLLLLFVVDACMKFSSAAAAALQPLVAAAMPRLRSVGTHGMAREMHELFVHWVEHGLVRAADVFPTSTLVLGTWTTYACSHAACPARFVGKAQRDVHMDLHFDDRYHTAFHASAQQKPRAWVLDHLGTAHPVPWEGYFYARRRKADVVLPSLPCSPLAVSRVPQATCDVCGDALPDRRYADGSSDWVYDDCMLLSGGRAVHRECCESS